MEKSELKKCFHVEIVKRNIRNPIVSKALFRFDDCDKDTVYRYIETEFPEWDPIHIMHGYTKNENL